MFIGDSPLCINDGVVDPESSCLLALKGDYNDPQRTLCEPTQERNSGSWKKVSKKLRNTSITL
ncbi:MAG: hypothetical protein P8175_19160, partial [Deltaproteobacteria bacterium]